MGDYADSEKRPFAQKSITAVSTDGGIEVFYNGDQLYADVAGAAGGDVTFQDGTDAAAALATGGDDSVGVPTLNGLMDVSNAGCDTAGEFVDHINKSTNWRARPLAMRRADFMDNTLITRSVAQANLVPVTLLRDTTVSTQTATWTIGLRISASDLKAPISGGWQIHVTRIYAIATCTAGTGTGYNDGEGALEGLRVLAYSVNDVLKSQRRLWTAVLTTATAATYVAEYDGTVAPTWGGNPLSADPGDDMLILIQNSGSTGSPTTPTSPTLTVDGYMTQVGGSRTGVTFHQCNV